MKAKHDGDGKIFFEQNRKAKWLCEVPIEDGDFVAKTMNFFAEKYADEVIEKNLYREAKNFCSTVAAIPLDSWHDSTTRVIHREAEAIVKGQSNE